MDVRINPGTRRRVALAVPCSPRFLVLLEEGLFFFSSFFLVQSVSMAHYGLSLVILSFLFLPFSISYFLFLFGIVFLHVSSHPFAWNSNWSFNLWPCGFLRSLRFTLTSPLFRNQPFYATIFCRRDLCFLCASAIFSVGLRCLFLAGVQFFRARRLKTSFLSSCLDPLMFVFPF